MKFCKKNMVEADRLFTPPTNHEGWSLATFFLAIVVADVKAPLIRRLKNFGMLVIISTAVPRISPHFPKPWTRKLVMCDGLEF